MVPNRPVIPLGLLFLTLLASPLVLVRSPSLSGHSLATPGERVAAELPPAIESAPYDWVRRYPLIAHALGGIGGHNGTNSLEGLEHAYNSGHRVFETDIIPASDGQLVLRHDWGGGTYKVLGQRPPNGGHEPLTPAQFKALKIWGKYTPMTFKDLAAFLSDHPDALVVTDTKEPDPVKAADIFREIVEEAREVNPQVLRQLIPQLYKPDNYEAVNGVFPFRQYIYTLYMNEDSTRQVVDFASGKGIRVVVMDEEHYSPELVGALKAKGIDSYINTLNDVNTIQAYRKAGVKGVMTDFVEPGDLTGKPKTAAPGASSQAAAADSSKR